MEVIKRSRHSTLFDVAFEILMYERDLNITLVDHAGHLTVSS